MARGKRHHFKKAKIETPEGAGDVKRSQAASDYQPIVLENELFEEYYKELFRFSEEEWSLFMEKLRSPLPSTFRITGTNARHAVLLNNLLQEKYLSKLNGVQFYSLPWFPKGLGWCLEVDRKSMRKDAPFTDFHKFLVAETEVGNITRQEAVSMIPPLLLGVESHHYVLDMCAAPGSKTTQLLEALHEGCEGSVPAGLVIANDADNKRAYTLVHQAKRLQSPCLVVTNHDGTRYPKLWLEDPSSPEGEKPVLFDRILCDVPCSGDGTMRKNALLWKNWLPSYGWGLHSLQLRLVERALRLLKVGGRLVYSTCSFNPVENEAVVATILNRYKGCIKIVDVSDKLKDLKREPGLTSWKMMDKEGNFYDGMDSVDSVHLKRAWSETMFPPKNVSELNLEKCLRLLPHHQNTGGFFVTVLEKFEELPDQIQNPNESVEDQVKDEKEDNVEENVELANESEKSLTVAGKKRQRIFKEDPFVFIDYSKHDYLKSIESFFGLTDFPFGNLLIRQECADSPKVIYFVSDSVKSLLSAKNINSLHIVNTGLKTFNRCSEKDRDERVCMYRMQQEALQSISPFIKGSDRSFSVSMSDLKVCLDSSVERSPFDSFESKESWINEPIGSLIFKFESKELNWGVWFIVWKGRNSIQTMVTREEKVSLLRLAENLPQQSSV